jgi:hypothetical protein
MAGTGDLGLSLATFPVPGARWSVPSAGWHVDSYGPGHNLPGVSVFAFLGSVRPGGGTVDLSGSHRLVDARVAATGIWRPPAVRVALASAHPWLRDLWGHGRDAGPAARLMTRGAVIDGTRVRVEMPSLNYRT